jgi:hypothetical protein
VLVPDLEDLQVEKLVFQSLESSVNSKQSKMECSVESDRIVIKHKPRLNLADLMEKFLP